MKQRNGFVSNSSSSSYVIALRKVNTPCSHCGRKDLDLLDMISEAYNYNDDNRVRYRGHDVLTSDYFLNLSTEEQNKIREHIKNSDETWELADISISYHNNALRAVFDNLVASKNMIVLVGDDD